MKKEKKRRKGKQPLGSLLFVLFVWELFVCFTNSVCNLLPNCPSPTIKLGPTHKDRKLRLNQNSELIFSAWVTRTFVLNCFHSY